MSLIDPEDTLPPARSPFAEAWEMFRGNTAAMIALVVLGRRQHDLVYEYAGNAYQARWQTVPAGNALDLHDDQAAAVARGLRDSQCLQWQGFVFHCDVALFIRGSAAQEGHVNREGFVEQVILAVDIDHLDQVLGGALVEFTAVDARVDEGF